VVLFCYIKHLHKDLFYTKRYYDNAVDMGFERKLQVTKNVKGNGRGLF